MFKVASHGGTALHAAAYFNHKEVTALLIVAGASTEIKNKSNISARHNVETQEMIQLFDALERGGIDAVIKEYPQVQNLISEYRAKASFSTPQITGVENSTGVENKRRTPVSRYPLVDLILFVQTSQASWVATRNAHQEMPTKQKCEVFVCFNVFFYSELHNCTQLA